jgi:condensin complex subunit 2
MEEISTSFCFICLLHLANEQGLKIESSLDGTSADMIDTVEEDDVAATEPKKIANIWDLKVSPLCSTHTGSELTLQSDIPRS